jgi:hypothetical protein
MRKLTYEFVKSKFEERGYTLLSNEYINSKVKLDYICPEGHEGSITYHSFQRGNGCPICGFERGAASKRIGIATIKKDLESEGYILITKTYKNSASKLECICDRGHRYFTTRKKWVNGHRCPKCSKTAKPSFEEVKNSFESEGYTLLSTEYVNAHTKLKFICSNGHEHSIKWNSWQQGQRCFYCSSRPQPTIEEIAEAFATDSYTLLSTVYTNNHTKLKYKCPYGHKHAIRWSDWYNGVRCPTCYKINNFGENNPNWQGGKSFEGYCQIWKDKEFKEDVRERDGNVCLNPYCSSKDPNDLTIHHINYNKKECHPKNLITVCRSCNARANFDRRWHKAWYQAILNNRYKYNY